MGGAAHGSSAGPHGRAEQGRQSSERRRQPSLARLERVLPCTEGWFARTGRLNPCGGRLDRAGGRCSRARAAGTSAGSRNEKGDDSQARARQNPPQARVCGARTPPRRAVLPELQFSGGRKAAFPCHRPPSRSPGADAANPLPNSRCRLFITTTTVLSSWPTKSSVSGRLPLRLERIK